MQQILLASRPAGEATTDNFRLVEVPVPDLADGQVLVQNLFLSLDPYMRGRMNDAKSYARPQVLGEVMGGGTAGVVITSRSRGIPGSQTGAVTAIQRVGSFANANVHFHTLIPEGVWYEHPDGSLGFHALPPPTDEDVVDLATRIVRNVGRLLARRDADADADAVDDEPEALSDAQAEAVQLPISLAEPPPRTSASRRRCALIEGFSLHADTVVDAGDRAGLERLVRYLLRPLISADRLTRRPDGRVEYRFRRADPSGRTSWVTDGASWCRRLATLVPPRRSHTTRFHGVLASAHAWRARVVPAPEPASSISAQPPTSMLTVERRLDWAALLRRVFGDQVTECPRCQHQVRVLAFLTDPVVTARILEHLDIATEQVNVAPARAGPGSGSHAFDFDS